jgi:integrase
MDAPTTKKVRTYRTGSLRQINGVWHVRYYDTAGNRRSESASTTDRHKAERFLAKRIGQIAAGQTPEPKSNVGKMAKAYFIHLEIHSGGVDSSLPEPIQAWRRDRKQKEFTHQKSRWTNHLEDRFAGARSVRKDMIDSYIAFRREQDVKDPTIMRELALLRRILNYNEVRNVPKFPRLAESAPRQGFIEEAQFRALHQNIRDAGLRAMVTVLYRYGFRKSELQNLLVRQIEGRELRLFAGTTKNSRARKVILDKHTFAEVEPLLSGKSPDDFAFTWELGKTRGGQIKDFRSAWKAAVKAAGFPDLDPHDLRRSSIRNMVRRGIHERVARQISGHLTSEVFGRYDIIADSDLVSASEKIGTELGQKQA